MSGRRRPLYFRLLGVRHLHPRPWVVFLLFEGSIVLGVLLAFADLVSPWGAVAIPVAVAIMVKLNDRVARAVTRPVAVVQLAATPRPRDAPAIGIARVPNQDRPPTPPAPEPRTEPPAEPPPDWPGRGNQGHFA